jgi:D-alanyl-D-alanine carboxypeptidase
MPPPFAASSKRLAQRWQPPERILAVQVGAGPVTTVSTGYLDLAGTLPIAAGAPYYLGSISKTYTATVVLRLAEEGRLSLDDPLSRWLPEFPRAEEITLRHLLSQTSGLKDFVVHLYFRPDREEMVRLVTKEWTEPELLELAGRFGNWFDPGTDWDYSNANYVLLAIVVERASGLRLAEAYRAYVYESLGIHRTWLAWHEEALAELPPGFLGPVEEWPHSEMFGELGSTVALDRSPVEWGAGGLVAPATDAVRFLSALFHGELLRASSLESMTEFHPTPPLGVDAGDGANAEEQDGYGLGLIRMVRGGFTMTGHGGLFTGHSSGLWHVRECDATIAMYYNRGFVGQRRLLDSVLGWLAEEGRCEIGVPSS